MIDADGILNDMIDNLIISPVKEERGIKIGAGTEENILMKYMQLIK